MTKRANLKRRAMGEHIHKLPMVSARLTAQARKDASDRLAARRKAMGV